VLSVHRLGASVRVRADHAAEGAAAGAERHGRESGLRVPAGAARVAAPGVGGQVVPQRPTRARLPVDPGARPAAGPWAAARPPRPLLPGESQRRRRHPNPRRHHRTHRRLQMRRLYLRRRGLHGQADDSIW